MDWNIAIERQSKALKSVIAALFAMLTLADGSLMARISPALRRKVLRVLSPAESALRRLIVIAARGLVVKLPPQRPFPAGIKEKRKSKANTGSKPPPFRLHDTRKYIPELVRRRRRRYTKNPPRVWSFDRLMAEPIPPPQPAPPPKPDDGLIDAARIGRRLEALKRAFEDIPGQAKRLARWRAKRKRQNLKTPTFTIPMRPGPPPGNRKVHTHEIDNILADCHALAWWSLKPDTS